MDMNALMNALLSADAVGGMSQVSGASQADVKNVLAAALPQLLSGAQAQANGAQTAAGFAGALADHAKADTSDLSAFMNSVDMQDGGKIIGHLLGSNANATAAEAADRAGLDPRQTAKILALAAPLLLSLLGQQTQQQSSQNNAAGIGGLMGALLGGGMGGSANTNAGGMDMSSLLMGLLGANAQPQTATTTSTGKKKKKKPATQTAQTAQNADSGVNLLGSFMDLLR